jgi:nickel/cobalt exporter
MIRIFYIILFLCLITLITPYAEALAHVIPTVTHTITVTPEDAESQVTITYFYDPVIINRFLPEFDSNKDGTIDESEKKKWGNAHLGKISFSINDTKLALKNEQFTIPSVDGLMNSGEPVEITGTLLFPVSCKESTKLHITDNNTFMSLQDDIYTFVINKKGCLSVSSIKAPTNEAIVYIGKALSESEIENGVKGMTTTPPSKKVQTTASQISEITQILKNNKMGGSLLLWAIAISFVLGGLHALTPGHGKTLVAAYLVGQHGTKKDALILALVTTITHTSSIYILGLISLFAAQYFLPEKIIPTLEVLSALSIFGLGVWLLSKRWDEFKHRKMHDHSDDHVHGTGPGQHTHTLSSTNSKLGIKSLVSLGFSGGIVPCADALAIMIIAIGMNKAVLGMVLILFFSVGLAAVLVSLGLIMVTSRALFERYAPSAQVTRVLPVISALIIIGVGGLLVLKAMKII